MKRQYIRLGWWYGCALLYFWFFAAAALHAYRHPFLNWDMVAYMGVAESFSAGDPQKIYDTTMTEVSQVRSPEWHYQRRGDILSNRSEAFYQQLPFYSVKPLYTGGIWLLHALGMAMPEASWVLSILGFLGLGMVCYLFVPRGLDAGIWWGTAGLFCALGAWSMSDVARLSTPDTLCIALSAAGYCLWIYRRSFTGFAACFLLAQLARPDMLLLSSALALGFIFFASGSYRMSARQGCGFIAMTIILYMAVNYLAGNYGWKVLFFYKFIKHLSYPAHFEPHFGWEQYIGIVRHGTLRIMANARLQFLLVTSLMAALCQSREERGFIGILAVTWLAFAVRFALFPAWGEDRYYYPYYFIMLYAIAEAITPCLLQYWKIAINSGRHEQNHP